MSRDLSPTQSHDSSGDRTVTEKRAGGHAALADERFDELKRAQAIIDGLKDYRESLLTCPLEIEPAGRRRIRDLCTPPKDDHDRAVLLLLDDMERLIKFIARPAGPSLGVDPPAEA